MPLIPSAIADRMHGWDGRESDACKPLRLRLVSGRSRISYLSSRVKGGARQLCSCLCASMSILVGRIRDIRNRHRLSAMPTTPGPGGRVTRNCERRRAETHRGEASDAAHRNSYTHNFGAKRSRAKRLHAARSRFIYSARTSVRINAECV